MRSLKSLSRLLREFWAFARERKVWWLIPIVLTLLIIGVLVATVSSISPFIYSLF
ncbi:MAG: hypothetical protein JSS11_06910 [Verrucomicrobia bacterium]|nr:hypothetical protein [Verrucomicrobiota bacterium]